ncbi:MAG: methyltransferase [Proteobacteria bacterium]|nr:methyltransferase [Pseudomonadota bacterium]
MLTPAPFDKLRLRQYPPVKQGQAYNGADTLLVQAALASGCPGEQILVVNDEFGALCLALRAGALWTDSWLASQSLKNNLAANEASAVKLCWSTEPLSEIVAKNSCALIVMRVPKQQAYFEYQLSHLATVLPVGTTVLVAGMDKHLSPATAKLLETYIGPTERHRGQRKARMFTCMKDSRRPAPYAEIGEYFCEPLNSNLISMANVFAREKMDIGSRFLLENIAGLEASDSIIDLACGNGIIGLSALSQGLCKKLLLCDESAMAIESARRNAQNVVPGRDISFHHGDGLIGYTGDPVGLILCNPPFHLNHAVDETVGRRLLVQAAAHLLEGGSLCLVANRHLNYLPVLKREFKRVEKLAQNGKFIIWKASR